MFALADGITITLGGHVWSFGLNIILYIIIAAIVGLLAEAITGWRVPFGFIGAIIAALIGIWLMTQVIVINGISVNGQSDLYIWNVPIIRALIGAIVFVAIWHIITFGVGRRRSSVA
jgi:uncharacterized membrane protein YeaQ/YmgE (transglycosylase-associated protein family)